MRMAEYESQKQTINLAAGSLCLSIGWSPDTLNIGWSPDTLSIDTLSIGLSPAKVHSVSCLSACSPPSLNLVSRGQPLSFWERVWSNAIELPVLVPTIIGGDRNAQMHYLTALNAESAEQMALLHLTRLFTRRKEAGHARLASISLHQSPPF